MRIAINCRSFLKKRSTGIGRYAENLVRWLAVVDAENDYWLYARRPLLDRSRRWPRCPARNFILKKDCWGRGPAGILSGVDIYHAPSPEDLPDIPARRVVTVHDLIHRAYPQGHTAETIRTAETQIRQAVECADRIICCSRCTAQDLRRYFGVDPRRVAVIYQGVDEAAFYPLSAAQRPAAVAALRAQGIDGPFILFVGTIEPRKNLANLLRALAILRAEGCGVKLVVVGMKGWMSDQLAPVLRETAVQGQVIFLGYVSDDLLRACYNCCEVFVFPSFYEGFGFPIVEAFRCGAAVVASAASSCSEMAADGARLADPADPRALAREISGLLADPRRKTELIRRARLRAEDFSFRRTAEQTRDLYVRLADGVWEDEAWAGKGAE